MENDDMITRIKTVMEHYGLTPSVFADEIGIQRSGLSHLLSGRNNPSLDVVRKIVSRFPQVDIYWLLDGNGIFPAPEKRLSEIGSQPSLFDRSISSPTEGSNVGKSQNNPILNIESGKLDTPSLNESQSAYRSPENPQNRTIPENSVYTNFIGSVSTQTETLGTAAAVKKISQIIVYFDDGTFQLFKNE